MSPADGSGRPVRVPALGLHPRLRGALDTDNLGNRCRPRPRLRRMAPPAEDNARLDRCGRHQLVDGLAGAARLPAQGILSASRSPTILSSRPIPGRISSPRSSPGSSPTPSSRSRSACPSCASTCCRPRSAAASTSASAPSAVSLLERPPGGGPHLATTGSTPSTAFRGRIAPTDWFTFTPGRRRPHHRLPATRRAPPRGGGYVRALGELGFDSVLRASGTFDYRNPVWDIDGLRHLVTPVLSYRYIPEADKGRQYIPEIDRQSFSTVPAAPGAGRPPLHRPAAGDQHRCASGWTTSCRPGTPGYGSRDLVDFNVADDLNFHRSAYEPDFSDLHTHLSLTPATVDRSLHRRRSSRSGLRLREFNSGHHPAGRLGLVAAAGLRLSAARERRLPAQFPPEDQRAVLGRCSCWSTAPASTASTSRSSALSRSWPTPGGSNTCVTASRGPNPEGHFGFQVNVEALRF